MLPNVLTGKQYTENDFQVQADHKGSTLTIGVSSPFPFGPGFPIF